MNYLNIGMPPNLFFIKMISEYAHDLIEKEKLIEMSNMSEDGVEIFYDYITRERRNVYEILFDFKSVRIPLEKLIDSVGY